MANRFAWRKVEMKVGYNAIGGYSSTAYTSFLEGQYVAYGVDKYTEEPVKLRWGGTSWHEVTISRRGNCLNRKPHAPHWLEATPANSAPMWCEANNPPRKESDE